MSGVIEPGAVIEGKYRVLRRIGEGGMGTVYEGENTRIERRVAIKVLHAHVASSPEFAQRFEREARASARIGSQFVCDVLDLGDLPNGDKYIVMEYLDGESLEDRIDRGKMTPTELAPIAFELLDGLGSMHQAGVVHRDLKPANVFLAKTPRGRTMVKILDFGVAKIVPRADESGGATQTGMMMGTPLYMSPEQARGARDVDGRTDLYAASVIFYRALTGAMPHEAVNLHELLFKIVLEDPRPILKLAPEVDPEFAALVTKGLIRDVHSRYTSAREYQEALAEWGARQSSAALRFSVTLPSEQPPLRTFTAFPTEPAAETRVSPGQTPSPSQPPPAPMPAIPPAPLTPSAAAQTPNDTRARAEGPPTPSPPGVGISQTLVAGAVPNTPAAGGTPMGWSEDRPINEAEARTQAGGTMVLKSTPPPRPSSIPPPEPERLDIPVPSMPASAVASSGGRVPNVPMVQVPTTRIAIGGAVAIAAIAVLVGARVMKTSTPATAPSATAEVPTTPVSVATTPVQVPDPPPATETTSTPTPSAEPSATASVQRPVTSARDASAPLWLPPTSTPKPSVAPTPTVAPASSHRKFRVDL